MSSSEAHPDDRDHLRTAPGFTARLEWPPGEATYFLGIASGTFSLYVAPEEMFQFDLEGRLRRASTPGLHYLRGFDGTVLRKLTARDGKVSRGASPIGPEEVPAVFERAHACAVAARRALETVSSGSAAPAGRADAEAALELLGRAASYDPVRLAAETARFREVYEPLSMLPPDRYRALVLQATTGCSWGQCAFCSLYRDVPYRRKSPEEFRRHVIGVKTLLGRALDLKSGVFLGDANALELPADELTQCLEIVREECPAQVETGPGRRGGISAFTDVFHGGFHDDATLRRLASLGLERVYLGIESGDDEVLRGLRKPATHAAALRRVGVLKEAGLPVGLIFLVGAGGRRHGTQHVEGTLRLVEALPLGPGDVVYLSPLRWDSNARDRTDLPLPEALSLAELDAEERILSARLRSLGLRVSRYDLASFLYY